MSRGNPYGKFQIGEDGVTYKGRQYPFTAIKHIFFGRLLTEQRMNFMKVGTPETAVLSLTMTDGTEVEVTIDETGFLLGWNKDRKQEITELSQAYAFLAGMTFPQRLLQYERQLATESYFQHGDCRFYPPERILFRNTEFRIPETDLVRVYGCVVLMPKRRSFLDRLKSELPFSKTPHFSTLTDGDVVFHLLKKYFGLCWQD